MWRSEALLDMISKSTESTHGMNTDSCVQVRSSFTFFLVREIYAGLLQKKVTTTTTAKINERARRLERREHTPSLLPFKIRLSGCGIKKA